MTSVADNLRRIAASVPAGVELVAVSKFHPAERLREAYDAGQRVFAESRANELVAKAEALPSDIRWHFIGHLQTNKVRRILPYVSLIQSVDSEHLLRCISDESVRAGRVTDILLEVTVGSDESKTGFRPDVFKRFVDSWEPEMTPGVRVCGIMGMATLTDDTDIIRRDFTALFEIFTSLKDAKFRDDTKFSVLSMGMSDDRGIAVECGSTMVRVGTDIFGQREY